ncbi:hypothetical protein [Leptolyngbya sp. PCC 6406]|nr:hypothetical protein [Leptolyngbya sp. PCC 6406]
MGIIPAWNSLQDAWYAVVYEAEDIVVLESLGLTIAMADLYQGVTVQAA